jgi:hypothetical protein
MIAAAALGYNQNNYPSTGTGTHLLIFYCDHTIIIEATSSLQKTSAMMWWLKTEHRLYTYTISSPTTHRHVVDHFILFLSRALVHHEQLICLPQPIATSFTGSLTNC